MMTQDQLRVAFVPLLVLSFVVTWPCLLMTKVTTLNQRRGEHSSNVRTVCIQRLKTKCELSMTLHSLVCMTHQGSPRSLWSSDLLP